MSEKNFLPLEGFASRRASGCKILLQSIMEIVLSLMEECPTENPGQGDRLSTPAIEEFEMSMLV